MTLFCGLTKPSFEDADIRFSYPWTTHEALVTGMDGKNRLGQGLTLQIGERQGKGVATQTVMERENGAAYQSG